MSRKSLRNASKHASRKAAKLGLSSLALGSVTFGLSGLLQAQNAQPAQPTDNTPKPKVDRPATKSNRWRAVRLAANDTAPPTGAGMVAQSSPAATAAAASTVPAPTTPEAQSANALQEIVVTGIRGSLERALQIKRLSLGVVDAVSAEDIGQFPDSSIGESVGRIPGVTVNRGSINQMAGSGAPTATGSVTGVTVRGFADQFNELLVEGRPIASGNGQTFDFSTMSANYVGEIDVHKTPDFSISSGAVGATINVKFPNPFDNPGLHAQGFVSATDYTLDGGTRPAFGGLLSDTFADGKFGVLVDVDYTDHHILGHHQDIVGWKAAKLPCSAFDQNYNTVFGSTSCAAVGAGATGTSAVDSWYPQDMAMYLERTDSRRKDGRLAFQWHPTDNVLVTLDDNYSSDNEHQDRFQRSTWFGVFPANGPANVVLDNNSTVTDFTDVGPTDFNSFVADTYIVTNTPGINVTWDVNDDWTAELDADQSVSKLNPNGGYTDVDADVGYGPNTAVGTNAYSGGVALNSSGNVLPYWTAVGPNTAASGGTPAISSNYNGLNPYIIGSHVFPLVIQQNSDRINQAKLDATWHEESTRVNFGAQFVDDLWNSKSSDTFANNYWQLWGGYGPGSNNYQYYCSGAPPYQSSDECKSQTSPPAGAVAVLHGVSLPPGLFSAVNITPWMPGYSGAGNLPSSLLEFSPYSVLNYLITQPINQDWTPSSGAARYSGGYPVVQLNPGTVQHVDRKNYSPFVTAEHNFELGDMTLKVDAGLRWQRTMERIAGLATPLTGLSLQPSDVTAYNFSIGTSTWTERTFSYSYLLPSLDLNLMVRPDLKVRADFSRTETPPNNGSLIPNTLFAGRVGSLNATGNNPDLLPYLSNNFDLGAEWYYASNDYVSADGFFKHVTQFPVSSVQMITVPGVIDPSPLSANYGKLAEFAESTTVNGLAANVTGVEVTWQQMLGYGFGLQINGTYAHSNANFNAYVTTANQFALPGIGNSANFIGFYQRDKLQARLTVQWQGAQLASIQGQEQNGGDFAPEPVYLASSTEVDFSTQYDVTSHLSAYFEALNLTDTVFHEYGRFSNQTLNLVDYGRSFTFGVRAKF
ncbi:MAG TPA: TonB-dependent receptor [Steroidobacteraceae bacterium]|nr:TonB-dependent receptor [Steroidobacteraceae bacterium]